MTARSGRSDVPVRAQRPQEQHRADDLGPTLAIAEPVRPSPAGYTEQRARDRRQPVRAPGRSRPVRGCAAPRASSRCRRGQQHARQAEDRDAEPALGGAAAPSRTPPASSRVERAGEQLAQHDHDTPIPSASQDACTPSRTASSGRPAPNRGRRATVVPYSTKVPTTVSTAISAPRRRARRGRATRDARRRRCRRAGRAVRQPGRRTPTRRGPAAGGWPRPGQVRYQWAPTSETSEASQPPPLRVTVTRSHCEVGDGALPSDRPGRHRRSSTARCRRPRRPADTARRSRPDPGALRSGPRPHRRRLRTEPRAAVPSVVARARA